MLREIEIEWENRLPPQSLPKKAESPPTLTPVLAGLRTRTTGGRAKAKQWFTLPYPPFALTGGEEEHLTEMRTRWPWIQIFWRMRRPGHPQFLVWCEQCDCGRKCNRGRQARRIALDHRRCGYAT